MYNVNIIKKIIMAKTKLDEVKLDEVKSKSITNLTQKEAKDFAIDVVNVIVRRFMDEGGLLRESRKEYFDGQWTDAAKEKLPLHTAFVETVKEYLSEVLSDEEINILFRMEEVSSTLKMYAKAMDLEDDEEENNLEPSGYLIEDLPSVIIELHKQRTLHAEGQQQAKIDELTKQVASLEELVEKLQTRVENVVPKE